jgi:ketosteroid isomerase-like protein
MRIFILCTLLFLSCFSKAQSQVSQVLNNMKDQEKAWNNGDIPTFMKHYWQHDSLKFIGSKGVTYGWQKTLDNYERTYPDKLAMGELRFTIIEATALSKSAVYVIGKWELQKDKPAGGHFTLLWRKVKGRWVIVADHTS